MFPKISSRSDQSDHSDCFFRSAYEIGPIRLFVLIIFGSFRVTKACFVYKRYVSMWCEPVIANWFAVIPGALGHGIFGGGFK